MEEFRSNALRLKFPLQASRVVMYSFSFAQLCARKNADVFKISKTTYAQNRVRSNLLDRFHTHASGTTRLVPDGSLSVEKKERKKKKERLDLTRISALPKY